MTMGFSYLVLFFLASFHTFHCNVTKDILFVLDSSKSIGEFVFYGQMIPVVEHFVRFHSLKLDPLKTRVGMTAFGGGQHLDIPMKNNGTKDDFINTLRTIPFRGGAADLHNVLNHVLNNLLTPENGDRADAENVLILMTDGGTTNPLETFTAIDSLKARGVTIYVVVAGCRFNWFNIHQMATNSSYIFTDLHHLSPTFTAYHVWTDICKCQLPTQIVTAKTTSDLPHHYLYTGSIAPTAKLLCIDNDNDCELIPKENCVKYRDWAMGSCRKTCGLCPMVTISMKSTTASPKPTIVTPKPATVTPKPTIVNPQNTIIMPCIDNNNECEFMTKENCVKYRDWAMLSCRKTCGLCPITISTKLTTASPKPTTVNPQPTTVTPQPTTVTPQYTVINTIPKHTSPKSTITTPKLRTTTSKHTTTSPKPTTTTPKPTTTTPKPTTTMPKLTTHRHSIVTIRSIVKGKEEVSLL